MVRWEGVLGKTRRISYAGLLDETSRRLRNSFVHWVSELGRPYHDSLDWWMMPLAGRNITQTPIFLHLCYLDILRQVLTGLREDLVVVCEDWFLLRAIELNLKRDGYRVKRTVSWPLYFIRDAVKLVMRFLARWAWHISYQLYAKAVARLTMRYSSQTPGDRRKRQVLVHTCVDEACFSKDGTFRDRYFTDLHAWLEARGYEVTIMPWLYNVEKPRHWAYRWFRENPHRFLILEDYVRVSDYPKCIWQVIKSGLILRGKHTFGNDTVTPLVVRERIVGASAAESIRFLLYMPAVRRWLRAGHRCDVVIDMFENAPCERPLIKAFKHQSPETIIVGYQHSMFSNELIQYRITREEWSSGVFPHRIVANGKLAADHLLREGFGSVCIGPALRYKHLLDERRSGFSVPSGWKHLLVVLPLELSAAVEVVARLLNARCLLEEPGLQVGLKNHPMVSPQAVMRQMGIRELPRGWAWAAGSIYEQLQRATLVVGAATSALFDAAALGIPVMCLGRELGLAFNPLDHWQDKFEACRCVTPELFESRLKELLSSLHQSKERSEWKELSSQIVAGLGRFDDVHFSAFIGNATC